MGLINSNFKDYLLVDIYDMVLVDDMNNVIMNDRLTNCSVECTAESTPVKAGKGNSLVATLKSAKELKVTTEYPVFNYDLLVAQMAGKVVKKAGKTFKSERVTLDSTKKATLKDTPVTGGVLKAFGKTGEVTATITGKEITATTGASGDELKVVYEVATSPETEVVEINSKNFPKSYKMYLTTLVIDAEENPIGYLTLTFPKAKMSSDFNMSVASERNANPQSIVFDILSASDGALGTMEIAPIEEEA